MDVSKVTFESLPLNGTGEEDKTSIKVKLLKWMQAHPEKCKHTNCKLIGDAYVYENGGSGLTIQSYLTNMVSSGMVDRRNGLKRGDFKINYFHPAIPRELLDTAPEEDKKFIEEVHERAKKMGGEVGSEGEIVTASTQKTAEAATEPETTEELPVTVTQTKKGTQITFTININL